MNSDILFFFEKHMDSLPLYQALEEEILKQIDNVRIEVRKSQISFYNKHLFACVSFMRLRKKSECPISYIVVTFGLNYKINSSRITIATEPYPSRWTHHIIISQLKEIDDQLMAWLKEAAAFSAQK